MSADLTVDQASGRRVSARISAIAESATLAVDAKAKALKAAGRPVIGFGAGEPDFPTPDYIVEAAITAARQPKFHRYSPAAGLPELRSAIAAKTLRDSGYAVDPSQVVGRPGQHPGRVASGVGPCFIDEQLHGKAVLLLLDAYVVIGFALLP